jgi:hypothetical protein
MAPISLKLDVAGKENKCGGDLAVMSGVQPYTEFGFDPQPPHPSTICQDIIP